MSNNNSNGVAQRCYFLSRNFKLSYLDTHPNDSSRETILFLHGFPDSADMWQPQLNAMVEAGFRCIAPDTLSCGESEIVDAVGAYNAMLIAGDSIALLDHLGIEKVNVAGHDWGAILAWLVTAHYPERVLRLVAMSVGHPKAYLSSGFGQLLAGWYTMMFKIPGLSESILMSDSRLGLRRWANLHPDVNGVHQRMLQPGKLTAALNIYRASLPGLLFKEHPHVCCPTLGIWSNKDKYLIEGQMQKSDRFVDARWRYASVDCGHWISLDKPDWLNAQLLEHFSDNK